MYNTTFIPAEAEAAKWILAHAKTYRVRPDAVLRELLQNATDAITQATKLGTCKTRLIEVAILSQEQQLSDNTYHLVIRDSAEGICRSDFDFVRVMGRTSKPDNDETIGEFGVGIYSVHAVITDALGDGPVGDFVFLSQKHGERLLAMRYDPARFGWEELDPPSCQRLLAADFANHPAEARRRPCGTSVYLRICPAMIKDKDCQNWLAGPTLALAIIRDCLLLPQPIYVADYSRNPLGAEIRLPVTRREIRETPVNLKALPWEVTGAERDAASKKLLEASMPFTDPDELPDEHTCVSRSIGDGKLDLCFFVNEAEPGIINLHHKRMWVEVAPDLTAPCTVFGNACINITPGHKSLRITLPITRDHVFRDAEFRLARSHIQDMLVESIAKLGKRLLERIHQMLLSHGRQSDHQITEIERVLNSSTLYTRLCRQREMYPAFLADVTDVLLEIINSPTPGAGFEVQDAIIRHYKELNYQVERSGVAEWLKERKRDADRYAIEEEQSQNRQYLRWTPKTTREYLKRVGPYLPVTVYRRSAEQQPPTEHTLPLGAIHLIDPSTSTKGICVLSGGRIDALFRKERDLRVVVVPRRPAQQLIIAAVSHLNGESYPLRFVTISKDLFVDPAIPEEWTGLIDLFAKQILAGQHQGEGQNPPIEVAARGFVTDVVDRRLVPLIVHKADQSRTLVINVNNQLMLQLNAAHRRARDLEDVDSLRIIAGICHELYHHAQSSEYEGAGEDTHCVETRNAVFEDIVTMVRQYSDLQRQRDSKARSEQKKE